MKDLLRWPASLLLLILLTSTTPVWGQNSVSLTEEQIQQKVDSVMQKMSLTDKVGEITQLAVDMISKEGQEEHQLDEDKLKEVLLDHRVSNL